MELQIRGKTGLVTGASAGIGRATAIALGKEGARLAIAGRRQEKVQEVSQIICDAGGPAPTLIVQDMMEDQAPAAIAEQVLSAFGRVDILINNAGGSRPFTLDSSEEQWNEALTLNFTRHRQLTHKLLNSMMEGGWGRIINITGKSEPDGINGAFCAKAAVHSWAKGLSREVGKKGITVNCIPPGRIMSDQILRNYTPEYRAWQSEHEIPMGRYGEPEDIAALICFLASPLAQYITGTVIPVDGGLRRYQF
jgi:3-oxoacyl-[acyl-carrier protein] reductase